MSRCRDVALLTSFPVRVSLFFVSFPPPGRDQIEVVFTSNGESADMYVERLTEELKDAGCPNVMVSQHGVIWMPPLPLSGEFMASWSSWVWDS